MGRAASARLSPVFSGEGEAARRGGRGPPAGRAFGVFARPQDSAFRPRQAREFILFA